MPGPPARSAALSLERLEDALGDTLLVDAARGRSPYLFAALKSLPLQLDAAAAAAAAGAVGVDGRPDEGSRAAAAAAAEGGRRVGSAAEQRALAAALLAQVERQEMEGAASRLEDDEALLAALEAGGGGGGDEGEGAAADARLAAAVRYRLERKRLLRAARVALSAYQRGL